MKKPCINRSSAIRAAGFTLIEMLISLAILGMIATMLLGGLRTVGLFHSRDVAKVNAQDSIVAAHRLLRDRVEQLRAVIDRNSVTAIIDANGDEDSFSFIAPPLGRDEPDGLWRYRIAMSATGGLMLYTANALDERYNFVQREVEGWQPRVILRDIKAIKINYYGQRRVGPGSDWQLEWAFRPQPPTLVRIRVIFPRGDRREWPDLIIRPRATENTACKIDVISGRCGSAT